MSQFYITSLLVTSILVSSDHGPIYANARQLFQLPKTQAYRLFKLLREHDLNLQFEVRLVDRVERTVLCSFQHVPLASERKTLLELAVVEKMPELVIGGASAGVRRISNSSLGDGQSHKLVLVVRKSALLLVEDCRVLVEIDSSQVAIGESGEGGKVVVGVANEDPTGGLRIRELSVDSGDPLAELCPNLYKATLFDSSEMAIPVTGEGKAGRILADDHTHMEAGELAERVGYLEYQLHHWSDVFKRFDYRVKKVELHQRGCPLNKGRLPAGQRHRDESKCIDCQCSTEGHLQCGPIGCVALNCTHPIHQAGFCCPECGKQCFYNGKHYENGEEFWPKQCVRCHCENGRMDCQFRQANACPLLNCREQETPPNQCCPVCVNVDHCALSPPRCHAYATCESSRHGPVCKCKPGYFGNGTLCYDIDECLYDESARAQLGGCGIGAHCINLPGAYRCDCLPGFRRLDDRTCLDVLRV